jgi:phytanoyl-CoA hydroxylase
MSYERYRAEFERQGFVVVRGFLGAAALMELQAQLDRYVREVVPKLPETHAFYVERGRPETLKQMQHMTHDAYFASYAEHPQWRALAEALLGEPVQCQGPEWFNKPPGTGHATPPHQDNYYFNMRPPQTLTIWLALDAVDAENGCLRYVVGSHRLGLRPHRRSNMVGFSQEIADYGPRDEAGEACVSLEPGDVVAHHGETIHRADANRSAARHRRAFAMVYFGQSARRNEEAFARYQAALRSQHRELGVAGT